MALLTVFSTFFAVYVWITAKKRKRISYSCVNNPIVLRGAEQIENLQVLYSGNEIPNLFISQFYIWNSGNEVISREDVVSSKPLCIRCDNDSVLLHATVILTSEQTNNFSITCFDSNSVIIDFDYFEPGDGLLVQVSFSGTCSDLDFDCKIKGGDPVLNASRKDKEQLPKATRVIQTVSEWLPLSMAIIVGCLSSWGISLLKNSGTIPQAKSGLVTLLFVIIIISTVPISYIIIKKLRQKSGLDIPKSLLRNE